MKTIILGFSVPKNPTWFAKSIMVIDKIPYDHVYVKWNWKLIERDIIYQASKFSVNFESNITFDSHAISIEEYEISISDECYKKIMQFCMDNSNKLYGIKEIIGFIWMKICKKCGKSVENPFPAHGATFVCSVLGAEIASLAGIEINNDFDNIDPLDLNNICKSSNLKQIK